MQGYNAQAAATADQVIVAAAVTNGAHDAAAFSPVLAQAKENLRRAGSRRRVRTVVADAGYWSNANAATSGVEAIIAPGKARELYKITAADRERIDVLEQVERGELTKPDAARRDTHAPQPAPPKATSRDARDADHRHGRQARHPARATDLPTTSGLDRASLRPDQAQPRVPKLRPSRSRCC